MSAFALTDEQRSWARVIGFAYLFAIPTSLFAEFFVYGRLIVTGNAAATAQNIMSHPQLYRLGIASNLSAFIVDVLLIVGLYVVLKPVNRNLALAALIWRVIETTLLIVSTLSDFDALRLLGSAEYTKVFDAGQLANLARFSLSGQGAAYTLALLLAGVGSTLFCYLWYQSRYIHRALAAFGIFASVLMATCMYIGIIFPDFLKVVSVTYYGMPIFIFELVMGVLLLFRGLSRKPSLQVS